MQKVLPLCSLILFLISFVSCNSNRGKNNGSAYDTGRSYTLRLNPETGSKYYYHIDRKSEFKVKVNGQKIDNSNKATVEVYYTINKDTSGNFLWAMKFHKIHFTVKNGEKETNAETDNTANPFNPLEKMLHILKDAKIIAIVSSNGQVKSVAGYEKIEKKILAVVNSIGSPDKRVVKQHLEQLIRNKLIKSNINQLTNAFPDSIIHVGDSWHIKSKRTAQISFTVNTLYTLKSVDKDIAEIDIKGDIQNNKSKGYFKGVQVIADLNGTQKGECKLDVKTGMLINSSIKMSLDGTLTIRGQEVPFTVKSRVEIEGSRIK